jgi:ankyrin repeat protein
MLFQSRPKSSSSSCKSEGINFISACRDGLLTEAMNLYEKTSPTERLELANKRDINGVTALMHAATNGRGAVIAWLVNTVGVDINAQDRDGTTALMRAAFWGHNELLHFLVEDCHADVSICNKRGRSAIHIAHGDQTKNYLHQCAMNHSAIMATSC